MNNHLVAAPETEPGNSCASYRITDPDIKASDDLLIGLVLLMLSIWTAASLTAFHSRVLPVHQWLFCSSVLLSAALLFHTLFIICKSFLLADKISLSRRLLGWLLVVLAMTVFVIQGTTAAARHDEIYSWNLWAIQHWQRVPHDLSYTQAPYPQLFSYWQASFYGAQNGIESQLLSRLATAVPTWILVSSFFVVSAGRKPLWKDLLIGVLWIFLLIDTWHTMRMGYADPLAIVALSVSLLCVLRYDRTPGCTWWLLAAALLGAMAAAIKQPGVIWSCFCLPCLTLWKVIEHRWPKTSLLFVSVAAVGVAGWLLLSMPDIAENNGVMQAAFRDRTIIDTILLSIDKYLLRRPDVLLVIGAATYLAFRNPVGWRIVLLGLLPFIGLWFTLGSYEYRHGVHVMWLSGILIAAALALTRTTDRAVSCDTAQTAPLPTFLRLFGQGTAVVPAFITALCIVIVTAVALHQTSKKEKRDISDGQRTGFALQMEHPQAAAFHRHVVDHQLPVWVTSNYSWGFFYGRLPVGRPAMNLAPTQDAVRQALLSFKPAYAISSGDYAFGDYSQQLIALTQTCQEAFFPEFSSRDGQYTVYRIDLVRLAACKKLD